jgi:hypothetical protein
MIVVISGTAATGIGDFAEPAGNGMPGVYGKSRGDTRMLFFCPVARSGVVTGLTGGTCTAGSGGA